jgi:hypothetical protein
MLRLHHDGVSAREIGRTLGVARSTIQDRRAELLGAGRATDDILEQRLFARTGTQAGLRRRSEPDWRELARELRRPGMSLMVLWEEYRESEPHGYGYSRFCDLFREFEVDVRITARTVEVFHRGQRVAAHERRYGGRRHGTDSDHMPSSHRRYAEWTHDRFRRWARSIGPSTEAQVTAILTHRPPAARARKHAATPEALRGTRTSRALGPISQHRGRRLSCCRASWKIAPSYCLNCECYRVRSRLVV